MDHHIRQKPHLESRDFLLHHTLLFDDQFLYDMCYMSSLYSRRFSPITRHFSGRGGTFLSQFEAENKA